MSLTQKEYEELSNWLNLIRQSCLKVEGALEEASSILIGVEDRGEKWAAQLHVDMGGYRENVAIIEQKARKEWIPKIKERCVHGAYSS